MPLPFLNYNPFDCTCPSASRAEYCAYCNIVCDLALADYESDIGAWVVFGQSELEVNQAIERQIARDLSLVGVFPHVPVRPSPLPSPPPGDREIIVLEGIVTSPLPVARCSLLNRAKVLKRSMPYVWPVVTKRRR